MKRRVILALCLLGFLGGSIDAAMAADKNHQVCIVFSNSSNYHEGQYICIDSPGN